MGASEPKLIVTLGPATWSEQSLRKIKDKGVDFVRLNMSHSTVEDLAHFLGLAKALDLQFILDTEGSQLRTGRLPHDLELSAGASIRLYRSDVIGDHLGVTIKPAGIVDQLQIGDALFVGFGTLVLRVTSVSPLAEGYVQADVVSGGTINQNKAVVVVSASQRNITPAVLTEKDYQSVALGLREGVEHIALSYVRRGEDVDVIRNATGNAMRIISKIESWESLENFDEIARKSDCLLLDRGDLSKEVPIERIPLIQKDLIARANAQHVPIYVATNFLESMMTDSKPTRAEVGDVINTILDGADGLILSAETAVGAYPFECINMMKRLFARAKADSAGESPSDLNNFDSLGLAPSHGGPLVDRFVDAPTAGIDHALSIALSHESLIELEQIATGAFSPLTGFMNEADFHSVVGRMRLSNDVVWPMPIVLGLPQQTATEVHVGDRLLLCEGPGLAAGMLHVEDVYRIDPYAVAIALFGSADAAHPGVRHLLEMGPVLVGGPVDLWKRPASEQRAYELTPRQTRRIFENRGWNKIAGFEHAAGMSLEDEALRSFALGEHHCDGLFLQPRLGTNESGRPKLEPIPRNYEGATGASSVAGKLVFSSSPFPPSYHADPRGALLRAILGKNFGCSHFFVRRDRSDHASELVQMFHGFPDLGIHLVEFDSATVSR